MHYPITMLELEYSRFSVVDVSNHLIMIVPISQTQLFHWHSKHQYPMIVCMQFYSRHSYHHRKVVICALHSEKTPENLNYPTNGSLFVLTKKRAKREGEQYIVLRGGYISLPGIYKGFFMKDSTAIKELNGTFI